MLDMLRFTQDKKPFAPAEITRFTQELSWLLSAGLPLARALALLAQEASNPATSERLRHVGEILAGGEPLSVALRTSAGAHFPPTYLRMIGAAERSGTLPVVLQRIYAARLRSETLRQRVRKAMIYPVFVLVVALIASAVILLAVVPQLRAVLPPESAASADTGPILRLLALSDSLAAGWPWIAAGLFFVGLAAWFALTRPGAQQSLLVFSGRLPLFGALLRGLWLVETAATLSMLLDAGMTFADALRLTRGITPSATLDRALADMEGALRKGTPATDVLARHVVIPPVFGSLLRVGLETGNLGRSFGQLVEVLDARILQSTETVLLLLEPLSILVVALAVGGLIYLVIDALMAANTVLL